MKEKLTRNIGLKILSVILAAILWLIIMNVDDPEETRSFTNVKVEILNDKAITSLDQFYEITEGERINFRIEARRSIREKLSESDFRVTADFSELSKVNAVPIEITCPKYGDEVEIIDGKYQTMKISMQDLITEDFKVDVIQKGVAASDFYLTTSASPNLIEVSGPRSRVDRIAKVVVEVNVTGMSKSSTLSARPKALDKDGEEIDASNLTFSENIIDVAVNVLYTKEINLLISISGEPAYGYVVTGKEHAPKRIMIAGEEENLKKIPYLDIERNITNATETIEEEINLQDELDEKELGLILVGEDKTAGLTIQINKLETKDISIFPGDIDARNKPENLNLSFNNVGTITFSVMGLEEDLRDLTRFNLKPYIDLKDYASGTYTLEINLDQAEGFTLANNPKISITLTEANNSE